MHVCVSFHTPYSNLDFETAVHFGGDRQMGPDSAEEIAVVVLQEARGF